MNKNEAWEIWNKCHYTMPDHSVYCKVCNQEAPSHQKHCPVYSFGKKLVKLIGKRHEFAPKLKTI